ncbi:MAG: hypothetical protein J6J35_02240 [Alphaproteobacteria bacterium]|nr:hypothetical protein [Alphaproteobacteria bacterium]
MRKILLALALVLFGFNTMAEEELAGDKIYFFTHNGCPYCEAAEAYISQNMKNSAIEQVSIDKPGGMYWFRKCVQKFKLGREVGTPLFCVGDEYLMGWSEDNQQKLVELSKKFGK